MAKTDLVMKDLAALFQSEASKAEVRAVPSVTAFDMDAIREIVKEELEKLPKAQPEPIETVIEVKSPAGAVKLQGVQHEKFEEVLAVVSAGEPVYLYGPAGTGKSHIAESVAKALKLDFYMTNCVTQEFKLTGFVDANGHYVETSFYKAFKNGGVFFLDELDGSAPEALININTALANKYFDFPGVGRVEAHKDFRCIAAGNTVCTGATEEYTGRFALDAASMDRFYFIHIDYSERIENALAAGDVDLVAFAHKFRESCKERNIQALFTYRSISRIRKLKSVIPMKRLLWGSLFKGMDYETVSDILSDMYEMEYAKAYRQDKTTTIDEIKSLAA